MHGLLNDEMSGHLTTTEAVTLCSRSRDDSRTQGCKPLWLTGREAEALLLLCTASPVSGGPHEYDLFIKLGDYFRSHSW